MAEILVLPSDPDALRLSLSKTKTFIDCKKKFEFTYIQKIPRKTWEFHTLGKFCHKVLEDFHQAYIDGSTEPYNKMMTTCFRAAQEEYAADLNKAMIKECFDIIYGYLKLITEDKKQGKEPNIIAVEKKFDFPISDKVVLNGMIDRIQLDPDGILHVADYKSTKNKKYLANDFFQLLTYAYVLITENPKIKKIRGSYILLRHNFEYLTEVFDVEEILATKDKYLKYANDIMNATEYPASPSNLCSFCDALEQCNEGLDKVGFKMPNKVGEVSW